MAEFWERLLRKMNWRGKRSYWQQDIEKREVVTALAAGVLILCGLAFLFYDKWWMALMMSPLLAVYYFVWEKEMEKKKELKFIGEFKDVMQLLASSLSAGYSVENAIRQTEKDLRPMYKEGARIRKELAVMVHQLNMNFSAERVMRDFAERVNQEDVKNFVSVFVIARRSGGDSVAIIREAIKMICDKIEVRQEIQVMTASKRYEFTVMTFIPLGIIFYMRFSFPEFLHVLYGNFIGGFIMTICLALYGVAYLLGKKVIQIEV